MQNRSFINCLFERYVYKVIMVSWIRICECCHSITSASRDIRDIKTTILIIVHQPLLIMSFYSFYVLSHYSSLRSSSFSGSTSNILRIRLLSSCCTLISRNFLVVRKMLITVLQCFHRLLHDSKFDRKWRQALARLTNIFLSI